MLSTMHGEWQGCYPTAVSSLAPWCSRALWLSLHLYGIYGDGDLVMDSMVFKLVGGLEHEFYFPQYLGWWSNLTNIFFQRGRYANQKMYETVFDGINDG